MDRYSRQRLFSPIGNSGQERLAGAQVTLVGCGALGSHAAQHLVRAGVGRVRIVDRDFVELDNLQRQVLFDEADAKAGLPKAIAAAEKLRRANSEVEIEPVVADLTAANVVGLIDGADIVLDGSDNFEVRFLINDACVNEEKPWVYAGVVASHGMVAAVIPGVTACFACLVPELPPPGSSGTCDTVGVISPAVALVAALQCTEALKILVGAVDSLHRGLVTVDPWRNVYRTFSVERNDDCEVCDQRNFRYLRREEGQSSTVLCGRRAIQITPSKPAHLDFQHLEQRLTIHGPVRFNGYLLRFEADGLEMTLFPDARAVIQGTDQVQRARAFYAKYIGT